jgi:hypothetical protein
LFRINQIWAFDLRGSGVHAQGTDANAGTCSNVDAKNCDGWCVYENSFLGNLHFGHHSESCYSGSFGSTNGSAFIGCYAEDGAGMASDFGGLGIGNTITTNNGNGPVLRLDAANGPVAMVNTTGGLRGTASSHTTDIASETQGVLSSRWDTNQSYPFRIQWEADGTGTFIRWASSANVLMRFGGGSSTATYGRSVAPGEHVQFQGFFLGFNANARWRSTGTAAPTTGTWARGDIVENINIASGQPMGWGCSVAGTPGTWIAMPNWP